MHMLKFNGVPVGFSTMGAPRQSYEDIGGFSVLRMTDGAGVVQQHWRKLQTVVTGEGWVPPGLAMIDWTAPVTLDCVAWRSAHDTGRVIALPTARRADVAPVGFAIDARGLAVPTAVEGTVGDVVTLAEVAGAIAYQVQYLPRLVCIAPEGVKEQTDAAGCVFAWSVTLQEQ